MSKAAQYRFIGANCARVAEKESNHDRKQRILHIARDWLALAENEEWLSASIAPFVNEGVPSSPSRPACPLTMESVVADVHRWEPATPAPQEHRIGKSAAAPICVERTPYRPDRITAIPHPALLDYLHLKICSKKVKFCLKV
jgi:hypothetical protein